MITNLRHQGGFLPDQRHFISEIGEVVSTQLGTEAVLQRGDDPTPIRVVLWVGRGDQEDVQRKPERIAAHLNVALLQDIEQGDLDALGQVRQLVEAENPSVGARHKP